MTVKELKAFLENLDEELEVCVMKGGGQSHGEYPYPIELEIETVMKWSGERKEMVIVK